MCSRWNQSVCSIPYPASVSRIPSDSLTKSEERTILTPIIRNHLFEAGTFLYKSLAWGDWHEEKGKSANRRDDRDLWPDRTRVLSGFGSSVDGSHFRRGARCL